MTTLLHWYTPSVVMVRFLPFNPRGVARNNYVLSVANHTTYIRGLTVTLDQLTSAVLISGARNPPAFGYRCSGMG